MARTTTRICTLSFALAFAACSGGDDTNVKIDTFTANPLMVAAGGTTNLTWSASNATNVTITANPGGELVNSTDASGTAVSAALTANTTFTMTAAGPGGPATRTVTVMVQGNNDMPMVTTFAASPSTIAPGGTATLMWTTVNADSVTITAGGVSVLDSGPANGNQMVMPADTTTYELVATGANGMAMSTVTITVSQDPIITSFTATPNTVDFGDPSTLAWVVVNADNVTVTDSANVEAYNGTDLAFNVMVTPNATETYTLVATNANGTDSMTAMVTVNAPQGPVINAFTAAPTTVNLGEASTLTWDVSNATSITIDDGAGTATTTTDLTGTWDVRPAADATFTLTASDGGANPDQTAMVSIMVNAAAPAVLDFSAVPNPGPLAGQTMIDFDVVGADTVRVLRAGTEIYTGTLNQWMFPATLPDPSNTFTLEATNAIGTTTAMLVVDAQAAPTINAFTVTPPTFLGTVTATLSYDVSSTVRLELFVDGALDAAFTGVGTGTIAVDATGTYSLSINATTEFRLVATSAGGTAELTIAATQLVGETEPNDDLANANPLVGNNNAVQGMIGATTDIDWFAITVPAGYSVRAETSDGMGGCNLDTTLTLTATDSFAAGDRLAYDDDGGVGVCSFINPQDANDRGATNLAAGTYYLVVQEFGNNNTGDYVLDIQLVAPACGDGIVNTGELCDDGNNTPGDGCDAACALEFAVTYTAPGAPMTYSATVAAGIRTAYQITATAETYILAETFTNAAAGECVGGLDTDIYLIDSTGAELAMDDFDGVNSCSLLHPSRDAAVRVPAGTYYLVVEDEGNNTAITFQLVLEGLAVDVCGNGIIDGVDTCDDGNTVAGDGCDATCQVEVVGTFVATGGTTQTFATNALAVAQVDSYAVQVPAGSDVYLRVETFDDAANLTCAGIDTVLRLRDTSGTQLGLDNADGVDQCSLFRPGIDGYARVTAGTNYFVTVEEDGNNAAIANYDVVFTALTADICGNTVIEGTEACDDGNTTAGDGCDAVCAIEATGTFVATAGTTQTFAGNALAIGQTHLYDITVPAGNDVYIVAETFVDAAAGTCDVDTVIRLFDNAQTEIGSDDEDGVNSCSLISATDPFARLTGGGTYSLTVEEFLLNGAIPNYDIVFAAVATDICGNGVVEVGEDCDDGNTAGGDMCPATCLFGALLTGTSAPGTAIPDNTPAGITDIITLPATPACTTLSVSMDIDITHTYRGDIVLDLTSPGGTTVRLKDSAFQNVDDVIGNYPNTLTPANAMTFPGSGNGAWTLTVADVFTGDLGTLNSWGLTVGCQ